MEEENKVHLPTMGQSLWTSPDVFADDQGKQNGESMSTPTLDVWPSLTRSLEDSEELSKQDSGYCSITPSSVESLAGIFEKKCQFCNKQSHQNYAQSTPVCMSCCKKKHSYEHQSPEYLQTISETKLSLAKQFLPRVIHTRPINLYDEVMDTSLYPDEMEVDEHISGEAHHFTLGLSEIGEEKSIDFVENEIGLTSTKLVDTNKIKYIKDIQRDKVEEAKVDESEQLLSPEGDIFTRVASAKVNNERALTMARSGTFQSVAKKVAKLNSVIKLFSLAGIERLDLLYHLVFKKNCLHIASRILYYLSEKDLDSVRVVSKTWNDILFLDFRACNRWKLYNTAMMMRKENFTSPVKSGRQRPLPLSPLHVLSNHCSPERRRYNSSPRRSPPVTSDSARFYSFQRAAKSLKKGERLLPCPKCYFPSHDHGSPIVQCSRSGCRHYFCVWCRNEASPNEQHQCPPLYAPRTPRRLAQKLPPVGSKSAKRNLRRL